MTPKQRAKELMGSFSFLEYDQERGVKINPTLKPLHEAVKQSASLCADEILSFAKEYGPSHRVKYYQSVKTEIQNL